MKELRNFKDIQNKNHDQYKKYRDYLKKEEELSELNKHLLQQQLLKEKLEAQNLEAQKLAQKKAQKLYESLPEEIKL